MVINVPDANVDVLNEDVELVTVAVAESMDSVEAVYGVDGRYTFVVGDAIENRPESGRMLIACG